jgi:hypothetical protein
VEIALDLLPCAVCHFFLETLSFLHVRVQTGAAP